MIQWVYESAQACPKIDHVIVATDDERILSAAENVGAQAMMTGTHHQTGTDRVGEIADQLDDYDVYVNIQGDQPFITPEIINALVEPFFESQTPQMATIACPLSGGDFQNPNSVKVICDLKMNAIYFSRSEIPFRRKTIENLPVYHHLGLYAFSRDYLLQFQRFTPTPLEQSEQLEQLRAVENGAKIRVSIVDQPIIEVNTPQDLVAANAAMAKQLEH